MTLTETLNVPIEVAFALNENEFELPPVTFPIRYVEFIQVRTFEVFEKSPRAFVELVPEMNFKLEGRVMSTRVMFSSGFVIVTANAEI